MRHLVLALIRFYQRHLSPHKGFSCAYRAHTGRAGCSALGYRAVRRHGVFTGLGLLRERTWRCGVAHRRYGRLARRPPVAQRGDCDLGCDLPCDCDLGSGWRGLGRLFEFVSCCDCGGCDWPKRRGRGADAEKYVHIPPKSGRRR